MIRVVGAALRLAGAVGVLGAAGPRRVAVLSKHVASGDAGAGGRVPRPPEVPVQVGDMQTASAGEEEAEASAHTSEQPAGTEQNGTAQEQHAENLMHAAQEPRNDPAASEAAVIGEDHGGRKRSRSPWRMRIRLPKASLESPRRQDPAARDASLPSQTSPPTQEARPIQESLPMQESPPSQESLPIQAPPATRAPPTRRLQRRRQVDPADVRALAALLRTPRWYGEAIGSRNPNQLRHEESLAKIAPDLSGTDVQRATGVLRELLVVPDWPRWTVAPGAGAHGTVLSPSGAPANGVPPSSAPRLTAEPGAARRRALAGLRDPAQQPVKVLLRTSHWLDIYVERDAGGYAGRVRALNELLYAHGKDKRGEEDLQARICAWRRAAGEAPLFMEAPGRAAAGEASETGVGASMGRSTLGGSTGSSGRASKSAARIDEVSIALAAPVKSRGGGVTRAGVSVDPLVDSGEGGYGDGNYNREGAPALLADPLGTGEELSQRSDYNEGPHSRWPKMTLHGRKYMGGPPEPVPGRKTAERPYSVHYTVFRALRRRVEVEHQLSTINRPAEATAPDPTLDSIPALRRTAADRFEVGGVPLSHYGADGEPAGYVILLHGLLQDTNSYLENARRLSEVLGYEVLLIDFPLHGESDKVKTNPLARRHPETRTLGASVIVIMRAP